MGRQILTAKRSRGGGGGGGGRGRDGSGSGGTHRIGKGKMNLDMSEGRGKHHSSSKQKNKGARWAKGQSCVSNPKNTTHRDQVSSTFLHSSGGGPGGSLLTVQNVHHNRGGRLEDEEGMLDDDGGTVLSSDVASLTISDNPLSLLSAASSIRTIASGWSQVSYSAFDRLMRKIGGDIVAHKDVLTILAAVSEIIGDAGGKRNETEFFATFMSFIGNCPPDQYQPVMSLVCIILNKVSPSVLKLRFEDIHQKIGTVLSYAVENSDELLLRTSIEGFAKLLKIQDDIDIGHDKALEATFYTVLKCSLHERPKVRRKVRQTMKNVLLAYNEKRNPKVISKFVIGWILDQLACYPSMCDSKAVTNVLSLLTSCWSALQSLPLVGAKKLFEAVLRVISGGNATVTKIGMAYFLQVFECDVIIEAGNENQPSNSDLLSKVLTALWDLQPNWRNIEAFLIWLRCTLLGIVRTNTSESKAYLPLLFEVAHPIWQTNFGNPVLAAIKEYIPHIVNETIDPAVVDKCYQIFAKSYLVIPPNPLVLQLTDCLVEQLGENNFTTSAKEVYLQLIPLAQSPGVKNVLGNFVKAFGIENLWRSSDPSTQWNILLPLLSDHLSGSSILFWKGEMLVQIGRCGTPQSIWNSFIGFARNPKDPENFPAELVGKVISEKPDLRLDALASLRQFIEWAQCKNMAIKYSKNYLPLLFNLYIQEKTKGTNPGHGDALGVTIQKYIPLCEDSFVHQLLEKAFAKLEVPDKEKEEEMGPVLDLIAYLSEYVIDSKLHEKILLLVKDRYENIDERKRMYRIMTFLSKNGSLSSTLLLEIYNKLQESKETKSNASALRLECVNIITEKNPEWQKTFLSEAIVNLTSANAKAKRCATNFLTKYCHTLKEEKKSIQEGIDVILPALKSGLPMLVSSATCFAILMYQELKPSDPNWDLLNACVDNMINVNDALCWKHTLAFLNLSLSLHKGRLGPISVSLGQIAGDPRFPRKEINKLLARMINTFGATGLRAVLPNAEDPKMHTRVKNLCRKLKKLKTKQKTSTDDAVSDDEEEDEFGDKIEAKPLQIKEGVVDFLNPKEMVQSLVSEKHTRSEDDFKQSRDGKLIIGSMDGDDDEDEDDLSIDSDLDVETIRTTRKRKSPASVASSKHSHKTRKSTFSTKSNKTRKTEGRYKITAKRKKVTSKTNSSRHSHHSVRFN